jgi:4,5-dihydroxyphthalate decarboxylase
MAPYVAAPTSLSRALRHSAVYIRAEAGIVAPADLHTKRIGLPEYQMPAVTWFCGVLRDGLPSTRGLGR